MSGCCVRVESFHGAPTPPPTTHTHTNYGSWLVNIVLLLSGNIIVPVSLVPVTMETQLQFSTLVVKLEIFASRMIFVVIANYDATIVSWSAHAQIYLQGYNVVTVSSLQQEAHTHTFGRYLAEVVVRALLLLPWLPWTPLATPRKPNNFWIFGFNSVS